MRRPCGRLGSLPRGWPRLPPGATRARTPGTAALAGSDCFPQSNLKRIRLQQRSDWVFGTEVATGWSLPRESLPSQVSVGLSDVSCVTVTMIDQRIAV